MTGRGVERNDAPSTAAAETTREAARPGKVRLAHAPLAAGEVAIDGDAAKYLARVRRLSAGDRVIAFDPEQAREADAVIVEVGTRSVRLRLGEPRPASLRASRAVTLIQAIGKGDKLDAVVRDATELGATRIVPAIAERSVARPADARARVARLRRIAIQAARQCGRGDVPVVEEPVALAGALAGGAAPAGSGRVCLDPDAAESLGPRLLALGASQPFAFVVGPEGGLSPQEIEAARAAGFERLSLGPFVLRTETVCAAVLGALLVVASRP